MKVLIVLMISVFISCNSKKTTEVSHVKRDSVSKAKRTIAASDFSSDYEELKKSFLAMRTANDFENFLNNINEYDPALKKKTYDRNIEYLRATLQTVRPFKGIFYRLKTLVKGKNVIFHERILYQIFLNVHRVNLAAPNAYHLSAILDYLSIPVDGVFSSTTDYQNYLKQQVVPAREKQLMSYKALLNDDEGLLCFDRSVFLGAEAFPDGHKQFVEIPKANIAYTISGIHARIQRIHALNAYDVDDLFDSFKGVMGLFGVNGIMAKFRPTDGVRTQEIVTKLRKFQKKNSSFLTLKKDGKSSMIQAYKHLRESYKYFDQALDLGYENNEDGGQIAILNDRAQWDLDRDSKTRRATVKDLLEIDNENWSKCTDCSNTVTVDGFITRRPRKLDIKKFYYNPPTNLLAILPSQWSSEPKEKSYNGKKYRNYMQAFPVGWGNIGQLQTLLPDANNKNLKLYISDIRKSYGRWVLGGIPLGSLVL